MKRVLAVTSAIVAVSISTAHASILLDLSTVGSSSGLQTGALGGTFYEAQTSDQPTGSGTWNSFLRVQANGSSDVEQGYNTDTTPQYDSKGGSFTHTILLSAIPTVTALDGTVYRVIGLDVNQNSGGTSNLLSLNQVQIFSSSSDPGLNNSLTDATATTPPQIGFAAGVTELFRMNNSSSTNFFETKLNSDLRQGSGHADILFYINNSAFSGASDSSFITLYSQFGTPPGGFSTNDGYEEWATVTGTDVPPPPPAATPEPSTIMGAGTAVLMCLGYAWRKKKTKIA